MCKPFPTRSSQDVRATLLAHAEIALLDVREEDEHAGNHPLFAANLPLGRIELEAYGRLPRRSVPIVLFGKNEHDAAQAARRLGELGYSQVALLLEGLDGWRDAGGELFQDVNAPSKAFGELVEAHRHTPSLSAEEVQALIDQKADVVIVDARRFDEYRTMSIPSATSVPGAELVLRVRELAPDPATRVIVNCAGRTRSIIGTQSLVNAGVPNPVAALRNGTIGWTLAGQGLDQGQERRFKPDAAAHHDWARNAARQLADRAGVRRTTLNALAPWQAQQERTTYFIDVRTPEEFAAGHLPGFRSYPGGQLVQETDMAAPVRAARIVLVDDDGVRANMSASWLAQMDWEVHVLDDAASAAFSETGPWLPPLPPLPAIETVSVETLAAWLQEPAAPVILDFAPGVAYQKGHLPGAYFLLRSRLSEDLPGVPTTARVVVTSPDGVLARFAAAELQGRLADEVFVLEGGSQAWRDAGHALETDVNRLASPPIDRYRRPYEGVGNARDAMQAYLDWEFGLVAQLGRDGTHGFHVIEPNP